MPPLRGWRGSGLPGLIGEADFVGERVIANAGGRVPPGVGARAVDCLVGERVAASAGGRVVPGIGARGVGVRVALGLDAPGVGVRVGAGVGVRGAGVAARGVGRLGLGVVARAVGAGVGARCVDARGSTGAGEPPAVSAAVLGEASFLITGSTSTCTLRTRAPCGPTTVAFKERMAGSSPLDARRRYCGFPQRGISAR